MTLDYLLHLTNVLAEGVQRLPLGLRSRHAAFLQAAQNSDGGFSGREGESDLYYTGFALRSLVILDSLSPTVLGRAAEFLRQSLKQQASVIDFFSLLYGCFIVQMAGEDVLVASPPDWPARVAAMLETFRTSDHGYAKATGSASGSVYHTFLVGLCYQLLGLPIPYAKEVRVFIHSRRRDDGGFVEIAPMRRSGTNPTAAGVGTLQIVNEAAGDALDNDIKQGVIDFLTRMVSPEGGMRGNASAPVADLLSTFTGLWTLERLAALDRINSAEALSYVRALELPRGGFRAGLWDESTDVEYTFYGLGCLALLPEK